MAIAPCNRSELGKSSHDAPGASNNLSVIYNLCFQLVVVESWEQVEKV